MNVFSFSIWVEETALGRGVDHQLPASTSINFYLPDPSVLHQNV
jgi:hypothetical protein